MNIDALRIEPGHKVDLRQRSTDDRLGLADKESAGERLAELTARINELQARLFAESERSVLLVLQALDGGGKDGTIRAVFTGVNPQGVKITGFKAPTSTDLSHDYLWRVHAALPPRGEIGVFNRSHYEDVLVVRVLGLVPEQQWRRRYRHIVDFERMLVDEGTTVVKCYLHISRAEQAEVFRERLADPAKTWKFRAGDLKVREQWDDYRRAYEDAIEATSTDHAPWYVIPADRNWVRNVAVAQVLVDTLERLDPRYPDPEPGLDGLTIPD